MGRAQEPEGDYGYDLVHQDVQSEVTRHGRQPGDPPAPGTSGEDTAGDYGYDEAHDF